MVSRRDFVSYFLMSLTGVAAAFVAGACGNKPEPGATAGNAGTPAPTAPGMAAPPPPAPTTDADTEASPEWP